jgi:hypothetical protein
MGEEKISPAVKLKFYGASVVSVLMYALETLPIRQTDLDKLEVIHRRCLRVILGFRSTDRISNRDLHQRANLPSIEFLLRRQRLRLIGHTARREDTRPARQAVFSKLPAEWTSKAGIRKTWRRTVEDDLQSFMSGGYHKHRYSPGFSWHRIIADVAADRNQWSIISKEVMRKTLPPQTEQ